MFEYFQTDSFHMVLQVLGPAGRLSCFDLHIFEIISPWLNAATQQNKFQKLKVKFPLFGDSLLFVFDMGRPGKCLKGLLKMS